MLRRRGTPRLDWTPGRVAPLVSDGCIPALIVVVNADRGAATRSSGYTPTRQCCSGLRGGRRAARRTPVAGRYECLPVPVSTRRRYDPPGSAGPYGGGQPAAVTERQRPRITGLHPVGLRTCRSRCGWGPPVRTPKRDGGLVAAVGHVTPLIHGGARGGCPLPGSRGGRRPEHIHPGCRTTKPGALGVAASYSNARPQRVGINLSEWLGAAPAGVSSAGTRTARSRSRA